MKLSLFGQFYLGVLATIFATFILVWLGVGAYLEKDAVVDFVADVEQETNQLRKQPHLLTRQETEQFSVQSMDKNMLALFLKDADYLSSHRQAEVYITSNGLMSSVYKYPSKKAYFVVTDLPQYSDNSDNSDNSDSDDEEQMLQAWLPSLLLLLLSLVLALIIYYLSRRIEKTILSLQQTVASYDADHSEIRANTDCPEPILSLAHSFNTMADRLDNQRNEQQIITHAIAHELRTPLARMQLALGMVNQGNLDEPSQMLLSDLDNYVLDMDTLTNELLTLGRVSQAAVDAPDPINLSKVIEQRLENLLNKRNITIHTSLASDILVSMHPTHCQLLIDNLVSNALAYSNENIWVCLRREADFIYLTIEDDGAGIADKDKQNLFVPFYRSDDSRNRKTGGYGLGLDIVDAVVNRYGGQIKVTDRESSGTCFKVSNIVIVLI